MSRITMLLVLLFVGWLPRDAIADELSRLRDQLAQLQQSVRELQAAQRDRGAVEANATQQGEQVRLDTQALHGAIDGVSQQLRMYMEEMNRFRQDVDERLRTLEEQMNLGGKRSSPSSALPSNTPPTAMGTNAAESESLAYQKGLNQVHEGDYLSAANTFRQFIQANAKSALVPNAQFWIGECFFAVKDYQRAIKEYQVVVERYSRSEKANAALLKQGMAFEALGMMDESKLFLQKLVAKAPNSPEARKAAERLKILDVQRAKYGPSTSAPAPMSSPTPSQPPASTRPSTSPSPDSNQEVPLAPGVKPGQHGERQPLPAEPASASGSSRGL